MDLRARFGWKMRPPGVLHGVLSLRQRPKETVSDYMPRFVEEHEMCPERLNALQEAMAFVGGFSPALAVIVRRQRPKTLDEAARAAIEEEQIVEDQAQNLAQVRPDFPVRREKNSETEEQPRREEIRPRAKNSPLFVRRQKITGANLCFRADR